ncbi:SurA N-terminal domain-containing protein [Rhodoferax sp. U11-2br]|uniref:SurA N-terminal domain-containing protein n=1 Tax=Rhodoferax sp. U11-2br TaxID=2838878 RepID=UPI001BE9A6B0|nr:SurA N-terminal domain-containing protein [Rhodoferax sp. U11-2br]MBT3067683.1 SurA N-terminal domain-containing protein [Rhodoferax sp. U11-2br]
MFDIFRKHTKIMMILLFLLIIPSFVLFGIDRYNQAGQSDEVVAKVGSVEITKGQWELAHKNEVDRLRAARPELDAKLLDSPQARFAVLERLVRERVMLVAAEKANLQTSDARLARFLQEDPTIASLRQADGKLDIERYRQLAASQGLTPAGFENSVRQSISQQQVEAGIGRSGFVAAAPADVALSAFFEKREVQVANFLAKDYAARVNPSDADLESFYQANQALFKSPEHAKVEYVVLDMDAVKKGIKLAEADVRAYYVQNVARLSGVEERRASHILISAPKDAPAADRQKAQAQAQALLKAVRAAPDSFADVAKKNSQDTGSASKGGDLDFFARGAMVKPFEDAAFAMRKGEISDLVESDLGYHIIKLTDVKSPKPRSFEELRPGLENDLKTQQAQRKFAEFAELFTNTVYEQSDSLKPVAEKLGLEVKTVDHLLRQPAAGATGVLASEKFLSALFASDSVENKRNTEAVETAVNQMAAGRVVAYSPASTLAFAEVKPMVRARVVESRAVELARQDGAEKLAIWKKAPDKASLPGAVVVSRDQTQNLPSQLLTATLAADTTTLPAWVGVDLGANGYAVARINKVLPRDLAGQANAAQDREQYARWWNAAETRAYYAALKDRLKVEVLVPVPAASVTQ